MQGSFGEPSKLQKLRNSRLGQMCIWPLSVLIRFSHLPAQYAGESIDPKSALLDRRRTVSWAAARDRPTQHVQFVLTGDEEIQIYGDLHHPNDSRVQSVTE